MAACMCLYHYLLSCSWHTQVSILPDDVWKIIMISIIMHFVNFTVDHPIPVSAKLQVS